MRFLDRLILPKEAVAVSSFSRLSTIRLRRDRMSTRRHGKRLNGNGFHVAVMHTGLLVAADDHQVRRPCPDSRQLPSVTDRHIGAKS